MNLKDRVAIVTGASRGIGKGIALGLAKAGADVIVNCSQNIGEAQKVAQEIQGLGRRTLVIMGDVSNKAHVENMTRQTLRKFGQINVLVNNAGVLIDGPIESLPESAWDRVVDVNLKGVFLCSQSIGQHMIKARSGGSIINIASISAEMPEVNAGAYTPSKAGVIGLTRLLAIEWAKYSIRVNALSPGPVMTPLQEKAYPTEKLLRTRNCAVPMNRHGTPEEMARIAVFLASDDSSYITGANIHADGGSMVSMFHLVHQLARNVI